MVLIVKKIASIKKIKNNKEVFYETYCSSLCNKKTFCRHSLENLNLHTLHMFVRGLDTLGFHKV